MRKNLLAIGLLALGFSASSQILTHVDKGALVTVTDGALVYNGGGFQVVGTGIADSVKGRVHNMGDIMVVGAGEFKVGDGETTFGDFVLQTAADRDATQIYKYGQLYISGIAQAAITGKVQKQYIADYQHSTTGGSQQVGLPFWNYTLGNLNTDLGSYLNTTNNSLTTSGRWAHNSVFRWNNIRARFDQIVGDGTVMGLPTDYYIVPIVDGGANPMWEPAAAMSIFKGTPVAEENGNVVLQTTTTASFGTDGSGVNYYRERYNTYLNDPFEDVKWTQTYAKRMTQFANPFLTNLDFYHLPDYVENVEGIAYFAGQSLNWSAPVGTTYNGDATMVIAKVSDGAFQAGPVDPSEQKLIIKPMGEVALKFSTVVQELGHAPTLDLKNLRHFPQVYTASQSTNPTAKTASRTIAADKLVRQVAVIALDGSNNELGRTYYAVSPSAVTGLSSDATLQAGFEGAALYTSEELPTGGADANSTAKLYINEANEVDFRGKEIPLTVNNTQVTSFKFLVYEGGRIVDQLSNGRNFYIVKDNVVTQVKTGDTMKASAAGYSLSYDRPKANMIKDNTGLVKGQTVIAKKDSDWVIRFADSWKSASVEVYSAAGRLIHKADNISTLGDYVIPIATNVKGIFVVKTVSDSGETVTKKVVN